MKIEMTDQNINVRHADNAVIDEFNVLLDNGIAFSVKAFNPHGFYRIHMAKGRVPAELEGSFTSADMAIKEGKRILEKLPAKQAA